MSNIDGINETPEVESAPEFSETITPETCDNVDSFNESMDARTEQLNSQIESSPEANDYVNDLADNYSIDDILSMKEEAGDPNEMREAFQNACFGDNDGISDDARAEMIEGAKGDWEMCQTENHMYDMALKRLGYDPNNEQTDDFAFTEASGDGGVETIGNDAVGDSYEMDDISQGLLDDKQDTINEFLDRNGNSVEKLGIDQYLNHDVTKDSNEFSDANVAKTSELVDADNGDFNLDEIFVYSEGVLENTETGTPSLENVSNEEAILDQDTEFSEFESNNQGIIKTENTNESYEAAGEQDETIDSTDTVDEAPTEDSDPDPDPILPSDGAPDFQNEREPSIFDRQAYNMDESYTNDGFSHEYRAATELQPESQERHSTLKETLSNLQEHSSDEKSLDETEQDEDKDKINIAVLSHILNNRGR